MPIPDILAYAKELAKGPIRSQASMNWEQIYRDMSVHVNGIFPARLITSRRPKEDDERYKYRQDIYEPITKGIIREAINSLFRIFDEKNYELNLSDDLTKYVQQHRYEGLSFMSWIQSHVVHRMILDPNAVVVVFPSGDGIYQSNIVIEPYCKLYGWDSIIDKGADYITIKSEEKSLVYYYNRVALMGDVYYIITHEHIYKYSQIGRYIDKTFELELLYTHNFGIPPYITLGGEWNEEKLAYESFFNAFLPFANEAIRQYSDWQGIMVTSAYPIRIVKPVQCTFDGCVRGYIGGEFDNPCPNCDGKGFVEASSPYGVYVREHSEPGVPLDSTPPVEYVAPPVDIIQFSMQAWKDLIEKAKEALHLDSVHEAQSGIAKAVDREREYAMILKISNNVYGNIIQKLLTFLELYRNIVAPKVPLVIKPKEFNLKTETDLIEDLTNLKKASAPLGVIKEVTKELLRRRYIGDVNVYNIQMFLLEYDPLYCYNVNEQSALLTSGVITRTDMIRSINAPAILDSLLRIGGIELNKDNFDQVREILDARITILLENINNQNTATLPF